ncbi:unnamed protein product [Closterium sp. NIES-54]
MAFPPRSQSHDRLSSAHGRASPPPSASRPSSSASCSPGCCASHSLDLVVPPALLDLRCSPRQDPRCVCLVRLASPWPAPGKTLCTCRAPGFLWRLLCRSSYHSCRAVTRHLWCRFCPPSACVSRIVSGVLCSRWRWTPLRLWRLPLQKPALEGSWDARSQP